MNTTTTNNDRFNRAARFDHNTMTLEARLPQSASAAGEKSNTLRKAVRAFFATTNNSAPLIARVTLGAIMLPHGLQKTLGLFGGYGYAGTMGFFTETMHIPALFAFLAIAAESAGAAALLAGLASRLAAFGIASVMAVAIATSHIGYGFFMNWTGAQKGEGIEYHLLALGLALIVLIHGAGKASLDALIARKIRA